MTLSRAQYVAQRVGARMQSRGDPMTLRRVSMVPGPVPYRNPPDVSADLTVRTGITVGPQSYLGIGGSSAIGRLIPGDQIECRDPATAALLASWTVQAMPTDIATDRDNIPLAAPDGTPQIGTPAIYSPDSFAAGDVWPVIPVGGAAVDPATLIGSTISFVFTADQAVHGVQLSLTQMGIRNLIEADQIVVELASYNGGFITAPKIDDQLIMSDGKLRAITSSTPISRQNTALVYQCRAA